MSDVLSASSDDDIFALYVIERARFFPLYANLNPLLILPSISHDWSLAESLVED
jgi:hypothetical protein